MSKYLILKQAKENIKNLYFQTEETVQEFNESVELNFPIFGEQNFFGINSLVEIDFNLIYKFNVNIPTLKLKIVEETGEVLYEKIFGETAYQDIYNHFSNKILLVIFNTNNVKFILEKVDTRKQDIYIGKNSSILIRNYI